MAFDRAAWGRAYRAQCRELGRCCQCLKPAVAFGCCEAHAERKRTYNRLLQREQKGCRPRYPTHPEWGTREHGYLWASEKPPAYYETVSGVICRVPVDWRDPLTILIQREAMGLFCFMRDRGLATAC